jgi:DNA polymerase-3 subunit alpha
LESLLEWSRETQRTKANGQKGLFDALPSDHLARKPEIKLAPANPVSKAEKLSWEKELLGLYVTSHPLYDFQKSLENKSLAISKISSALINRQIKIGGIISKIKKIVTRTGRPMLFLNLEDLTDKIEVVVFPGVIERNPRAFQENKIVLVSGRVDNRDGVPKLICEEVEEILEET